MRPSSSPTSIVVSGPIVSPLDVRAADDNKDSLAKMVYSRMFDWLVAKINTAIGQDPDALTLVGVLDIYGVSSLSRSVGTTFLVFFSLSPLTFF